MVANQYYVKYPVMQVRTWGLLAYDRTEWHYRPKKDKTPPDTDNDHPNEDTTAQHNKKYTGQLTEFARRRLKRAIQLLVASAEWKEAPNFKTGKVFKFKVNFITLTLPCPQGQHSDRTIKTKVLDPFIKRMKRKYKLNSYVWRAERQKNKNLHFHLITDTWIHYEKIRNDWNSCLNALGYIDEFERKHQHRNPNSTDVHAVWKVKNLTQYFIKYMAKNAAEGDVIKGKLWDCSTNLKTRKNCEHLLEGEAAEIWNKCKADESLQGKCTELYELIFLNDEQFSTLITGSIKKSWDDYLKQIRTPLASAIPPTAQGLAGYALPQG